MPFTFILSDENVNEYGYRLLTDGIDTADFEKNPVMLFNHHRSVESWDGVESSTLLPIGKWTNIRKQGGKLVADAEFDEDDEFAVKIMKKVEKGILNTASIHFRIVEETEDPAFLLPGQRRATVSKSRIKEGSITDIPGNANCHRLSYRNMDLSLSGDFDEAQLDHILPVINHKPTSDMDKKLVCTTLGLDENATDMAVLAKLTEIKNNSDRLAAENQTLSSRIEALENAEKSGKVKGLVDGAIASGKLTEAQRPIWQSLAEKNFDDAKLAIDAMQAYTRPTGQLSAVPGEGSSMSDVEEYIKLDKEGKLGELQRTDDAKFQRLYDAFLADRQRKGKIKSNR